MVIGTDMIFLTTSPTYVSSIVLLAILENPSAWGSHNLSNDRSFAAQRITTSIALGGKKKLSTNF